MEVKAVYSTGIGLCYDNNRRTITRTWYRGSRQLSREYLWRMEEVYRKILERHLLKHFPMSLARFIAFRCPVQVLPRPDIKSVEILLALEEM